MKMKKFLIVDDVPQNLEAARMAALKLCKKKAAIDFSSFGFLSSAADALKEIATGEVDGVVTDLFSPRVRALEREIKAYIRLYDSCDFSDNPYQARVQHNRIVLSAASVAVYGAIITLECFKREVPVVLITSMHRHVRSIEDWIAGRRHEGEVEEEPWKDVDGAIILAPLVRRRILSAENLMENYHPQYYLAGPFVNKLNPDDWKEAVQMCFSQMQNKPLKPKREKSN